MASNNFIGSMFWSQRTRLQITYFCYINTLKQELGGTKAYKLQNSADEKSVAFYHCCQTATKFAVSIKEEQERLLTI